MSSQNQTSSDPRSASSSFGQPSPISSIQQFNPAPGTISATDSKSAHNTHMNHVHNQTFTRTDATSQELTKEVQFVPPAPLIDLEAINKKTLTKDHSNRR